MEVHEEIHDRQERPRGERRRPRLSPGEQSGLAAGANDTFRQAGIAVDVAAFGALVPGAAALGQGGSPNATGAVL